MSNPAIRTEYVTVSSRRFVVELPDGVSLTRGWREAIGKAASDHPDMDAFVWDDILPGPGRRHRSQLRRLRWPTPEPLLLSQVSIAGRCAVLDRTANSTGGSSAALAELAKSSPGRIGFIHDVMRFVGTDASPVYRSISHPPSPPGRAAGLSVIINYRDRPELMQACLESLARQRLAAALEVILVDNQSAAASVADVRAYADRILGSRAIIRHVAYDAPYSHSAQNNLAADLATHDVLLLLNNDAVLIDPDCAQVLADWSLGKDVMAVAPRILGDRGQLVANGVFIRPGEGEVPVLLQENETVPLSQALRTGAGAPFSCAAVSRAAWRRLGGLDAEAFPTQYNDADFWLRGLEGGMHCIYAGHVSARHQPGHSEARTREITAARLAHLRNRHPAMERHAGLDPYYVRHSGLPYFDSAAINLMLRAGRLLETLGSRLLPPKAARR